MKRKSKDKPKRKRVKRIESVKPKRKRRMRTKKEMVICANHTCWYQGTCEHKRPHPYSKRCEQDFCSLMGIKTICKKVKEE